MPSSAQIVADLTYEHVNTVMSHETTIFALSFSPSADFLASGDEDSRLLIHDTRTWELVRSYEGYSRIRAMVWHPVEFAVISGSSNGDVNLVLFSENSSGDRQWVNPVAECVHSLDITSEGRQLAVAFGSTVALVKQTAIGVWGKPRFLPPPANAESEEPILPQNVHYVHHDSKSRLIIVTFLHHGIIAYSTAKNCGVIWKITPQNPLMCDGSSALSKTGEVLAVSNLRNGVDFYSVSCKKLVSSAEYARNKHNVPLGLVFLDDEGWTVAGAGVSRGVALFVRGMSEPVCILESPSSEPEQILQAVACGTVSGKIHIAAGMLSWALDMSSPSFEVWVEGSVDISKVPILNTSSKCACTPTISRPGWGTCMACFSLLIGATGGALGLIQHSHWLSGLCDKVIALRSSAMDGSTTLQLTPAPTLYSTPELPMKDNSGLQSQLLTTIVSAHHDAAPSQGKEFVVHKGSGRGNYIGGAI